MGTASGMDISAVRALSRSLQEEARAVQAVLASTSAELEALSWLGPDARAFLGDWHDQHARGLARVVEGLQAAGGSAARYATLQEQASRS